MRSRVRKGPVVFGYCQAGSHHLCPGVIPNGKTIRAPGVGGNPGKVLGYEDVRCNCQPCTVQGGHQRCRACGALDTVIDWQSQQCEDRADCADRVETRRANNPRTEMIRLANEAGKQERAEKAEKKAPKKAPKECRCECGEMTGGGLFRPGHDAKLKSRHLQVLRDPAQKPQDRQAAKDALKAERERSGSAVWLSADDEAIDVNKGPEPKEEKAKAEPKGKEKASA